ncbi:MAG: hypothetical protein ABJA90_01390 [Ginsengibacter sp.]
MKKLVIILFITITALTSFSQSDATKVEQYCEVIATPRSFSNKVTIDVNYGEERSLWKSNRLKDDEGKLKKFNSVIDALNYMGKDGWVFVNAFPGSITNEKIYHYVFKKSFLLSEVAQ